MPATIERPRVLVSIVFVMALVSAHAAPARAQEPSAERRMHIVLAKTTPFVAESTPLDRTIDAGPGTTGFVSTFLVTPVLTPASTPVLVEVRLIVDADRALVDVNPDARTGATADGPAVLSRVSCVLSVDGQAVGAPAFVSASSAAGPPAPVDVFDPQTGLLTQSSPREVPDAWWSSQHMIRGATAGQHELAVACQGRVPFRFRGVGSLTVLQRAPRG